MNDFDNDVILGNNNFDFNDFFFNDSDDNYSAIRIITPMQVITNITERHDLGAEKIMNSIFPDKSFSFGDDADWPEVVNDMGCISIQMLKDAFEIITIPHEINTFEFNALFDFYTSMVKVNGMRRKMGLDDIEMHTNIFVKDSFLELGRALIYLKKKINDDLVSSDEVVLEANVNKK